MVEFCLMQLSHVIVLNSDFFVGVTPLTFVLVVLVLLRAN